MTTKAKMLEARRLIEAKQYDEARAILRTIQHPTAEQWLAKLDAIAPEEPEIDIAPARATPTRNAKSGSGDILFWGVTGVVSFVIVLLVGFLLVRQFAPSAAPGAAAPDGCEAQSWYNTVTSNLSHLGVAYSLSNTLDEQIDSLAQHLSAQRDSIANIGYPKCVEAARANLLSSVDSMLNFTRVWKSNGTDVYNPLLDAMTSTRDAFSTLQRLGVRLNDADAKFYDQLAGACPVEFWTLQNVLAGNDFFRLFAKPDFMYDPSRYEDALQTYIFKLNNARRSLNLASTPPCLAKAKTYMLQVMDAGIAMFDAVRGQDRNGVQLHARELSAAYTSYSDEMKNLGVAMDKEE
jgi:hypothetical protein